MIDQIKNDLNNALKNGEKLKANTLRLLISSLKNKAIELGSELDDKQALQVIQKTSKQHKESIKMYKEGDRDDLAAQEEAELAVIEHYLPSMMGEDELNTLIDSVIEEVGAKSMADFGKVMPEIMKRGAGQVDGGMAQGLLKSKLS
ncbi:MAG: GatB/YqeY domain-containing protein [Candidatus Neomarinimicrobiota bacterium]|nr:GatB/YqeY domain-containing protein [Candidatus Neomarinimicrobiota bacterium]